MDTILTIKYTNFNPKKKFNKYQFNFYLYTQIIKL